MLKKKIIKNASTIALAIIIILMASVMILMLIMLAPKKAVYDCSISSFSPDYTTAQKKLCREKTK